MVTNRDSHLAAVVSITFGSGYSVAQVGVVAIP